jgi:undecaprenyl-diphosphatase
VDFVKAILYGIIQGVTEWLPISSTAHLRLVPSFMGWEDPGAGFTAVIQLGTVLAVLVYFGQDLLNILRGWINGIREKDHSSVESKIGWGAFIGTIPIVICGFAFKDYIKNDFRSLYVIAGSLIVMGLVMMAAEHFGKKNRNWDDLTVKDGIIVGLFQAIALIPGASRSGSTISGAYLTGLDRETAAKFSFILSVPSVVLAGLYEAIGERETVFGPQLGYIAVASLVSFVVGLASIHLMMKVIKAIGIAPFVYYRIALGAVVILGAYGGFIK